MISGADLIETRRMNAANAKLFAGRKRILGRYTDLWFLSVFCVGCQSQGLVAAVLKEGNIPEVVTDFTEEEYNKFCEMAIVGADDVLDLHNYLKDFDGDFSRVFSEETG